MYKLMQKYNKKLMAIFAVGLMIAFVIPQFSKSARTPNEVPVGTVGSDNITLQDLNQARFEWQMLKEHVMIQDFDPRTRQPGLAPLATKLGPNFNDFERHPVLFLLLQREAIRNGVTVSERDLSGLLSEIQVRLPDRNVLYDNLGESEMADNVRASVRAFMLVNASFEQSLSMIKISQPLLANRMARETQEIKLQLVECPDRDFTEKVPAPSLDQIKAQFDKYADMLAGAVDTKTNPFGFGYKYPDRVKLAYISIANDEVKKAVRANMKGDTPEAREYNWTVEARRYYKQNQSLFPTTAPKPATTQVSDALSLGATSKPATTRPTTKPFEEVRDTIVDTLIAPEAQKLEATIQSKLTSQMREDWNLYRLAHPTSGPATAPSTAPSGAAKATVSSVGVPYDSPDYLSKLAEQIQKQYKVVLTVSTLSEKFLSREDLKALPNIGKSAARFGQGLVAFDEFAIVLAEPFLKGPPPGDLPPIKLLEPSRPLDDFVGGTYIFRLTELDPMHKPADAREVLQKVEEDIRAAAAHELETAEASKLLESAKNGTLSSAAISAGKSVTTSGWVRSQGTLPSDLPVSSLSEQTFTEQTFNLLSAAAKGQSALALISLPRDHKSFVGQLADVRRMPLLAGQVVEPLVAQQIRSELAQDLFREWFRWDAVVARVGYVDASKKKDSEE